MAEMQVESPQGRYAFPPLVLPAAGTCATSSPQLPLILMLLAAKHRRRSHQTTSRLGLVSRLSRTASTKTPFCWFGILFPNGSWRSNFLILKSGFRGCASQPQDVGTWVRKLHSEFRPPLHSGDSNMQPCSEKQGPHRDSKTGSWTPQSGTLKLSPGCRFKIKNLQPYFLLRSMIHH